MDFRSRTASASAALARSLCAGRSLAALSTRFNVAVRASHCGLGLVLADGVSCAICESFGLRVTVATCEKNFWGGGGGGVGRGGWLWGGGGFFAPLSGGRGLWGFWPKKGRGGRGKARSPPSCPLSRPRRPFSPRGFGGGCWGGVPRRFCCLEVFLFRERGPSPHGRASLPNLGGLTPPGFRRARNSQELWIGFGR